MSLRKLNLFGDDTLVIIKSDTESFSETAKTVGAFSKRAVYDELMEYLTAPSKPVVCLLSGLRGTGKTTLMFQAMDELRESGKRSVYLCADKTTKYREIHRILKELIAEGYSYVFIDEITFVADYHLSVANLANGAAATGVKVVLSGTDSLGLEFSAADELFHRHVMLRTTPMTFSEFKELFPEETLDNYFERGGAVTDPHETKFEDLDGHKGYYYTAVANNITHTILRRSEDPSVRWLVPAASNGSLYNVLHKIAALDTHVLVYSNMCGEFASALVGKVESTLTQREMKSLLNRASCKYDNLKEELDAEISSRLNTEFAPCYQDYEADLAIKELNELLQRIDVLYPFFECNLNSGSRTKHFVLRQAGLLCAHVLAALDSCKGLAQDDEVVAEILKQQANGLLLENIVQNDLVHFYGKDLEIYKAVFRDGDTQREIDVVAVDKSKGTAFCFEVKNSSEPHENQCVHLKSENMTEALKSFAKVSRVEKFVIYRGKPGNFWDVTYLNAEKFLFSLRGSSVD